MSHPEKLVIPGEEPVGANIFANSSFENAIMGSTGVPDDWSGEGSYLPENYTVNPKGIAIDTTKAYSGKSSVRMTKTPKKGETVSLRQRFVVKPGETYRATVRYQADVKNGTSLTIRSIAQLVIACCVNSWKWQLAPNHRKPGRQRIVHGKYK